MTLLGIWFITYGLPAFLAGCWIKLFSHQEGGSPKNMIVIHAVLIASAAASLYAIHARGLAFPLPSE